MAEFCPTPLPVDQVTVVAGISSVVTIDARRRQVSKIYRPRWWVQALYWLAFQASFPYSWRREAIEAARERRAVAGALTRYWFGDNLVAPIVGISQSDEGVALVSQFVAGRTPQDRRRAKHWLRQLTERFTEAGLPIWQIAPYNPHAVSNLIERPDGRLVVIDLESTLVTPFGRAGRALRRGAYPIFDDADFAKLRGYVVRHLDGLTRSLGSDGVDRLHAALDRWERAETSWRGGEPRLLGRAAAWLTNPGGRAPAEKSPILDHQG